MTTIAALGARALRAATFVASLLGRTEVEFYRQVGATRVKLLAVAVVGGELTAVTCRDAPISLGKSITYVAVADGDDIATSNAILLSRGTASSTSTTATPTEATSASSGARSDVGRTSGRADGGTTLLGGAE